MKPTLNITNMPKIFSSWLECSATFFKAVVFLLFCGALQTASAENQLFLAPNGDFEDQNQPWGFSGGGPAGSYQTVTYPTTDGNPDGYVRIDTSADTWWTVLISNGDAPYDISNLGLVAGNTYTFQFDMRTNSAADNIGGMKVEAWQDNVGIDDPNSDQPLGSGDQRQNVAEADVWVTYTFDYTLPAEMNQIKFVPIWSSGIVVDFDNIGVLRDVSANYTVAASATPGGSVSPSGDVSVANGGSQTFTFTADTDYTLADVTVNGTSVGASATYEMTNVAANGTIEAQFSYNGLGDSDFENGGTEWEQSDNGTGTFVYSFPGSGGTNDSVYAIIDHSADDDGEGYLTANSDQVIDISYLNLTPGTLYNLDVDMIVTDGFEFGSAKVFFFKTNSDGDYVQDGASAFIAPDSIYDAEFDGGDWATYSLPIYIPHGTEGVKIRLRGGAGSVVGFDNVAFDTANPVASYAASVIPDAGFDYLNASYEENGAAEALHTFYPDGGNPGGYAEIDNSAGGWGLIVANSGTIQSLSDLGLSADETYQFRMDMQIVSGTNIGGLKIDFFNGTAGAGSTGDIRTTAQPGDVTDGDNWQTYEFVVQIPAGVDGLKFVPIFGADSIVGYDNLAVDTTPYVAPPTVYTWNGDGGDASWSNADNWDGDTVPNLSNSAFNSTVIIANANVQYDPGVAGGDFQLRNGNTLQLDAGGSFEQINSGAWFQAGGGVIKLNGGTFNYGSCPLISGREESTSILEVTSLGGTIINTLHTTELNWGTLTLNGPLSIEADGREIGLRGNVITLTEGSQWEANAISFVNDNSRLDISGGKVIINSGAGIAEGQVAGKGFNFLSDSAGEIEWGDAGVSTATIDALVAPGNFMLNGVNATASDLSISERAGNPVVSLANVDKTITVSDVANGSIATTGSTTVAYNGSESFTISADTGYAIADVLINGASVGVISSYTFTNVVQNQSISAVFIQQGAEYTISASTAANGSISPSGDSTVEYGNNQSYTITPDAGYYVLDVLVNGSSVGPVSSYEFTNVTSNSTISATFTDREFLKLDFQGALGGGDNVYNTAGGWITLLHDPNNNGQPWVVGDEIHPNVGGSGYDFTCTNVGAWSSGWFWNSNNGGNGAPFTVGGLTPGQEVILYAAAGWDGNMTKGSYIVFGDSGAAGIKAVGGGQSEGNNPLPADLTQIGTATADANGEVSGVIGGDANFTSGEGQTNGFIFSIGAAPENNFSNWIGGYSVGTDTGIDGDYDNDGLANGVENILGTDPSSADAAGISSGSLSGDTFTFTHPANALPSSDLTASYQWSTDLTNFYTDGQSDGSATVSFSAVTDSGVTTVTATITGTAPDKLFVQLSVSQ